MSLLGERNEYVNITVQRLSYLEENIILINGEIYIYKVFGHLEVGMPLQ